MYPLPMRSRRPRRFVPLGLLAVLIFAGCGYRVAIPYLKSRQPYLQQAALSNVYMIVQLQSRAGQPVELDIDRFASKMARYLRDRGARLMAYRLQGSIEERFVESLHPSSLLYVSFTNPSQKESKKRKKPFKK